MNNTTSVTTTTEYDMITCSPGFIDTNMPCENRAERRAKGIPKMKYCDKHKILSATHRCNK